MSKVKVFVATLMTLTEVEINTRVLEKLGPDAVKELEQSARNSSADTKRYKVLQLAGPGCDSKP
jgi:hypothetical protein